MSRRLVYITFGAVAGVLAVRRATRAAERYTPAGLQERVLDALGTYGDTLREFLADVRAHAAVREVELREQLGLDGTHDAVDAGL